MSATPDLNRSGDRALVEPPNNLQIEQVLLGAVLGNNGILDQIEFVQPEHFYQPVHQRIFAAVLQMVAEGKQASPITLAHAFNDDPALKEAGGRRYLIDIFQLSRGPMSAPAYAEQIVSLWQRREMMAIGSSISADAAEIDLLKPPSGLISDAQKRLDALEYRDAEERMRPFAATLTSAVALAEQAFKTGGKSTGLPTGIKDLDKMLGGLMPTNLLIIAGRPSMGKSALGGNIGFNIAKAYRCHVGEDGKRVVDAGGIVAFFSLEMSSAQLADRIIAGECGVPGDKIRKGQATREDFDRYYDAAETMKSYPFFIDDTPALTIAGLRNRCRRLKRKGGLDLVIIDYLQLMQGTGRRSEENRVQEVSEITRGLKALAKELGVPVIALSQLSRNLESRENKRPQLSDLKESGSIEQDADVVMFCYREAYYLERETPARRSNETEAKFNERYELHAEALEQARGRAEVIIGKQRHGPIGTVELHFDGAGTKFSDPYHGGAYHG